MLIEDSDDFKFHKKVCNGNMEAKGNFVYSCFKCGRYIRINKQKWEKALETKPVKPFQGGK